MILLVNIRCIHILTTHTIQSLLIHTVQANIAAVVIACSFDTYITIKKYRNKCDFRLFKNLIGML